VFVEKLSQPRASRALVFVFAPSREFFLLSRSPFALLAFFFRMVTERNPPKKRARCSESAEWLSFRGFYDGKRERLDGSQGTTRLVIHFSGVDRRAKSIM
jgi:hypothetical protein